MCDGDCNCEYCDDEHNCEEGGEDDSHHECIDSNMGIPMENRCDGGCDCPHCDDESNDYCGDDYTPPEPLYCDDGDWLPHSYTCDDYCDCTSCEDEASCPDGTGITKVDLGSISMSLNLSHDGGKFGIMTTDLIGRVIDYIGYFYYYVFHW